MSTPPQCAPSGRPRGALASSVPPVRDPRPAGRAGRPPALAPLAANRWSGQQSRSRGTSSRNMNLAVNPLRLQAEELARSGQRHRTTINNGALLTLQLRDDDPAGLSAA